MYTHFEFYDHSNPYITTNNQNLFEILRKYYVVQNTENSFFITGLREWNGKPKYNRENNKMLLRAIAQQWQEDFANFNYSYSELAEWQNFFEEYGKKYGLLKEFHENAIC